MELSTPLTVVVTSAWVSLINIVAGWLDKCLGRLVLSCLVWLLLSVCVHPKLPALFLELPLPRGGALAVDGVSLPARQGPKVPAPADYGASLHSIRTTRCT